MEISAVGGQAKPETGNATSFNWWLFSLEDYDGFFVYLLTVGPALYKYMRMYLWTAPRIEVLGGVVI